MTPKKGYLLTRIRYDAANDALGNSSMKDVAVFTIGARLTARAVSDVIEGHHATEYKFPIEDSQWKKSDDGALVLDAGTRVKYWLTPINIYV